MIFPKKQKIRPIADRKPVSLSPAAAEPHLQCAAQFRPDERRLLLFSCGCVPFAHSLVYTASRIHINHCYCIARLETYETNFNSTENLWRWRFRPSITARVAAPAAVSMPRSCCIPAATTAIDSFVPSLTYKGRFKFTVVDMQEEKLLLYL